MTNKRNTSQPSRGFPQVNLVVIEQPVQIANANVQARTAIEVIPSCIEQSMPEVCVISQIEAVPIVKTVEKKEANNKEAKKD